MASDSTKLASSEGQTDSVIVGLRIRPLLSRDLAEGAQECLKKVHGEPQVVLGGDPFVYTSPIQRPRGEAVWLHAPARRERLRRVQRDGARVRPDRLGKTHTMGTASVCGAANYTDEAGLIPRAWQLFAHRWQRGRQLCDATASFIEIYKEDVHDLLGTLTDAGGVPDAAHPRDDRGRPHADGAAHEARCRASTRRWRSSWTARGTGRRARRR